MRLRNKKTGEIKELPDGFFCGDNLKKICEEWEDYEEPKEYWYYDTTKNGIDKITHLEDKEKDQEIGNYFETKEEAEKAVEKLKAWKRLEDKGFKFIEGHLDNNDDFIIKAKLGNVGLKDQPDVHLLFGGEE